MFCLSLLFWSLGLWDHSWSGAAGGWRASLGPVSLEPHERLLGSWWPGFSVSVWPVHTLNVILWQSCTSCVGMVAKGAMYLGICWVWYEFPITAVTNDHKHSDFKQHKRITLQFRRIKVWHRSHGARTKTVASLHSFLEVLGENPFPGPFPDSGGCLHPLACGPSLHL